MKLLPLKKAAQEVNISVYELRTGALKGKYPFLWSGKKRMFDVTLLEEVIRRQMEENQREAASRCTNN